MIAEKDPYIESAYKQLQIISQDKQKRMEYEAREKAVRDYNQGMFEAEQRGEKRGEKRGRRQGIEIGEERINKLNRILISNGQYDELAKAAENTEYQKELLKLYGI